MSDIVLKPVPDGSLLKIDPTLHETPRYPLAFVSGDTVKSFTIRASGKIAHIVLTMPSFSGAVVTAKLTIDNDHDEEIYESTSTTMAENEIHVINPFHKHLFGESTVKVTLSADPLSSGICYVTMLIGEN